MTFLFDYSILRVSFFYSLYSSVTINSSNFPLYSYDRNSLIIGEEMALMENRQQASSKRPHFSKPILTILICLAMGLPFLSARNTAAAQNKAEVPPNEPALIDTTQEQASTLVLEAATWLDDFFNDDRATSEQNRTRLRVGLSMGYSKNNAFDIQPDLSGRIDLPHFSKKLNLVISASSDEGFDTNQNPISATPRHQGLDNRDITTALQYFFQQRKKYNISTFFGASFHYLYTGLRYRHLQEFGSWQGRLIDKLQYFTDDGLENIISYDFERYFSHRWLFRTTASADWYERRDGLPHSLTFQFYQIISQEKALLYEMGNYFTTKDSYKMTDLQLRLRYRQRFLRDWLVLELAPQLSFPEDHGREANPGITLRLEAEIGNLDGQDTFKRIFSF